MVNDENSSKHDYKGGKGMQRNGATGAAYCLAFIGAAVYYIQHATSFWAGVVGFLKALVWPAFLIYNLLEFLKM